jgi:protein-tyrosine phosphatase
MHTTCYVLAGSESVQTPREVYDQLRSEGYRVEYYRLPLTDGEAPKERIFDVFYDHVKDVHPSDALIFNCQMGGGRTTTGMVIGCLIRMHTSGQLTGLTTDSNASFKMSLWSA